MHVHTPALGLELHVVHAPAVKENNKYPLELQHHTNNNRSFNSCEKHKSQCLIQAGTASISMIQSPYSEANSSSGPKEICHGFMEPKGLLY
jgi:hypothetical protein